MGVNCTIKLPGDVRVRDVADVIARCAGCEVVTVKTDRDGYEYRRIPEVDVQPGHSPECATITVSKPVDLKGGNSVYALFFFEPSHADGAKFGRLLMPPSTSWWIAVGLRLIKFFGGSVTFNDCDAEPQGVACKKPRRRNNPEDGNEWQRFQDAKFAVPPLTAEEVEAARKFAAYK